MFVKVSSWLKRSQSPRQTKPRPEVDTTFARPSRTAYHDSTWRKKAQPIGSLQPPRHYSPVNVRIVVLGSGPEAQAESIVNLINFGDVDRSSDENGMTFYSPEYLCQDEVYSLDISELPAATYRSLGMFSTYRDFALIILYNVTSLSSFRFAQKQLDTVLSTISSKSGHVPFPIMMLGLSTNLEPLNGVHQSWQSPRQVSVKDASALAGVKSCLFSELSLRTESDVIDAFGSIVESLSIDDSSIANHSTPMLETDNEKQILMTACLKAVADMPEEI